LSTVTLASSPAIDTIFLSCYSGIATTPILDCNGTDRDVIIRHYVGGVEIRNFTQGNMTIDMNSGQVILASSCTGGTIVVRGICRFEDNSAGSTVVTDGLMNVDTIWDEPTANHQTAGSTGKALEDAAGSLPAPGTTTTRSPDKGAISIVRDSAVKVMFYMVLSSDHTTKATGKSLSFTVSYDGATWTSLTPGSIVEIGDGWYYAGLTAAHTSTSGTMLLRATASGCDTTTQVLDVEARPDNRPGAIIVDFEGQATTTTAKTDLTETATDFWKDSFIHFTTGALAGQVRFVTAYNGSTKFLTFDALTSAPSNGDRFVLVNA
jgi:hypothetical protein